MATKTYLLSFIIISVLYLGGCKKDFLNVSPTEQINARDAFSSPEKIQAAMTGIYDLTSITTNALAYTHNMILNADLKGGDLMIVSGAGNWNRFVSAYQFTETPNSYEPFGYWSVAYQIITNANQFVVYIPDAPLTEEQKTQYLAEARALRAEAYFWLVRWFAKPYALDPEALGVPILRKPLGPNETVPARNKVKEVYDFILEDFKFAEQYLPANRTNIYRMNVAAIRGYLARVYLNMENWSEASRYAKLARANRPLAPAASLLSGFTSPSSEWIYAINARSDDNAGLLSVHSFLEPYDVGYSSFRATDEFFNSFSSNDIRKQQFLVKSSPGAAANTAQYRRRGEGYLINKFDYTSTTARNQVLMRSSEMYLIEAEAEARQGVTHEAAAKQALFEIQKRAGVSTSLSNNTGQALIDEIMKERAKELYGEGHKFFDLLRTKTPVDRTGSLSHWKIVNFQPGDKRLVLPIPQAEINANPAIEPNPL